MRLFNLFCVIVALATAPSPAVADWLRPDIAFSATRTVRMGDTEVSGPYAYDHGKERFEVIGQGMHQVLIQRPDLNLSYVIAVDRGVGQTMTFAATNMDLARMTDWAGSLIQETGRVKLNGEEVTKYELTQSGVKVWFWRTDDGIPLRIVGNGEGEKAYARFEIELTDLARGPQPAALFEPPPGIQMILNPMAQ